jgi:hypothetical protein
VHPKPIRRLRDLTRYRRSLVRERSRERQRLEKTLEDAQIKLDTVVASLLSVSGRAMIEAMIAGERDPHVLAGMARGVMRRKIPQLEEALARNAPSSPAATPCRPLGSRAAGPTSAPRSPYSWHRLWVAGPE